MSRVKVSGSEEEEETTYLHEVAPTAGDSGEVVNCQRSRRGIQLTRGRCFTESIGVLRTTAQVVNFRGGPRTVYMPSSAWASSHVSCPTHSDRLHVPHTQKKKCVTMGLTTCRGSYIKKVFPNKCQYNLNNCFHAEWKYWKFALILKIKSQYKNGK